MVALTPVASFSEPSHVAYGVQAAETGPAFMGILSVPNPIQSNSTEFTGHTNVETAKQVPPYDDPERDFFTSKGAGEEVAGKGIGDIR
jgi:hypothetical protein